jgi:glutamyl endopeptidase
VKATRIQSSAQSGNKSGVANKDRFQPVTYEVPRSESAERAGGTEVSADRLGRWLPGLEDVAQGRPNAFGIRKIIGGADNRKSVPDPMAQPYAGILLLTYHAPNGEFLMGTGWLIAPTVAISAGHVVWDRDRGGNWSRGMMAYQGVRGNVPSAAGSASVDSMSTVSGWQQSGFEDCDFSVIRLSRPLSSFVFEFAEFAEADTERMNVNVVGYPSDGGDRLFQHAGQIFDARETLLYYQMDTMGGQSGCPLILWEDGNEYTVVGIHSGAGAGNYNQGVRIAGPIFQQLKVWRT